MKPPRKKRAPGQLRMSQMVTTYGPGAPCDLPTRSVLVGGLERWDPRGPEIHEPRLLAKVKGIVPTVESLHAPPAADDETRVTGVGTFVFPQWFLTQEAQRDEAQRERRRRLVHLSDLSQQRRVYVDEDKKKHAVVPVRFVRACPRGHIEDIDWRRFVHGDQDPCKRALWLVEKGTSGDLAEITIRCECGRAQEMTAASKEGSDILGKCDGSRPWLGRHAHEGCDQKNRLLIRTASNAYFTQSLSVISLPDRDEELQQAMEPIWEDFLSDLESVEELARIRSRKAKVKGALEGFSDEQVWQAILARRGGPKPDKSVKEAEFEVLAASAEEIGTDRPEGNYFARALAQGELAGKHAAVLQRVVLVHRLREVQALVGFTRFEAQTPATDGELQLGGLQRAALAREQTWLPAVETRGEGVFLLFRRDAIDAWAKRDAVRTRAQRLRQGYDAWRAERSGSKRAFCGIEYLLLHSLSHLLITAVSLGCGYPASSIRERVYALPAGYGILLYTASSDSEGTLGGLVEVGRRIGRYLDEALEIARLCANDPVCAQHEPRDAHERRFLHGAACHGCLLISETSCEQRNDFLDRALVVPTVEMSGAELFTLD